MLSFYTDFEYNPAECNSEGYPTTIREASKRLWAYAPARRQTDRLLGYADWIQVNGWQAVDPKVAAELRSVYRDAKIDPSAIEFLLGAKFACRVPCLDIDAGEPGRRPVGCAEVRADETTSVPSQMLR